MFNDIMTVSSGTYILSVELCNATVSMENNLYTSLDPDLASEVTFIIEKLAFTLIENHNEACLFKEVRSTLNISNCTFTQPN